MYNFNTYTEATTLDMLFEAIKKAEKPRFIAGGTDVLIKLRELDETFTAADLVGIMRIPELKNIYLDKNETLCIGAGNTFTSIENNKIIQKCAPLLAFAVSTVGGPQTRCAGTIGGNICNGATSADSAPTLFAYNAHLKLQTKNSERIVPIDTFYLGPGKVDLKPGEILVEIQIKKDDYAGFVGYYTKFAQRNALDIANLSCATLVKQENNIIKELRIAYGVAGPVPVRAKEAEEWAIEKEINANNLALIGEECLKISKARDSWRASKEYREHLMQILPGRNIMAALEG